MSSGRQVRCMRPQAWRCSIRRSPPPPATRLPCDERHLRCVQGAGPRKGPRSCRLAQSDMPMPKDLDELAALATEQVETAAVRVSIEEVLHQHPRDVERTLCCSKMLSHRARSTPKYCAALLRLTFRVAKARGNRHHRANWPHDCSCSQHHVTVTTQLAGTRRSRIGARQVREG